MGQQLIEDWWENKAKKKIKIRYETESIRISKYE